MQNWNSNTLTIRHAKWVIIPFEDHTLAKMSQAIWGLTGWDYSRDHSEEEEQLLLALNPGISPVDELNIYASL